MIWPSSSRVGSRAIVMLPRAGSATAVLMELMSPLPRDRRNDQNDRDEPPHRHPSRGVEAHGVGAAATLGSGAGTSAVRGPRWLPSRLHRAPVAYETRSCPPSVQSRRDRPVTTSARTAPGAAS